MKEKIYTIPVNDAFDQPCECPMCELENKTTKDLLNYYMGPSMMEPDVRIATNEKGFCSNHLSAMYNKQENRLGLGLMIHTHMTDMCEDVNKRLSKSIPSSGNGIFSGIKGEYRDNLNKTADAIDKRVSSCALCDRLEYTMDRYVDVILWLYFEDKKFKAKFETSKGFCLPHLSRLLRGVAKYLSQKEASAFINNLSILQSQTMTTMRDDLLWFTQKFDYKNENEPWGNSRDAVPRTIRKLSGSQDLKQ